MTSSPAVCINPPEGREVDATMVSARFYFKILSVVVGALWISSFGFGVNAQMICSEPLEPSCLTLGMNFDSEETRRRCATDAAEYIEKLDEFIQCSEKKLEESRAMKEQAQKQIEEIEAVPAKK